MSSGIGLYYPFIHFRDDRWVKQAVLYWDRLGRIVPGGYSGLHDSDLVRALKEEHGIVEDLTPSQGTVQAVSRELTDVITANAGVLSGHFAPDPFLDGDSLAYLYHTKMDRSLVQLLLETGLGTYRRAGGEPDDEWLGVHPQVGQAYMTALATQMAVAGRLDVASDDARFAVAGCGYPLQQIFANLLDESEAAWQVGSAAESLLAITSIEQVLPEDLDAVTIEEIVAFRAATTEARARYRQAISGTTDELRDITDAASLRLHLEATTEQVRAQVDVLRRQMDAHFGGTVLATFGVSKDLPDLAAAALGALGISLANPVVVAGAIAFAVYRTVREKREAYQDLEANPMAYLVAARDRWNTTGMLDRVRTGARRLILD